MKTEKYEVTFRDKRTGDLWTAFYNCTSFAEAESRAYDGAGSNPDEIIKITKDYES
jgi:hypothetical protein